MKSVIVTSLFFFLHRAASDVVCPHEQKCVASNDLTFNRISSITINKQGNKDCGKNCRIIYPNSTEYLIFYHQQENQIRCLCFDDKAMPIRQFIDENLCNIPCPEGSNKTCGGLHHSLASSKIQVYYSTFCIVSESIEETTTTITTISPGATTTRPVQIFKLSKTIQGYILDSYNKTVVIIVLQIILMFIVILALTWYSLCHEGSKLNNKVSDLEPYLSQGIKPTKNDDNNKKSGTYPPIYGSTEESDPGKGITKEGNSTFYE